MTLITKSNLILRDLDLLSELARRNLCSVAISLPTLDDGLKRIMEPRVPSAASRLKALEQLAEHGIPVAEGDAVAVACSTTGEAEAFSAALEHLRAANAALPPLRVVSGAAA